MDYLPIDFYKAIHLAVAAKDVISWKSASAASAAVR